MAKEVIEGRCICMCHAVPDVLFQNQGGPITTGEGGFLVTFLEPRCHWGNPQHECLAALIRSRACEDAGWQTPLSVLDRGRTRV